MGRTNPSVTQTFLREQGALAHFRRALRRSDQIVFDDLFARARQHLAAAAYASYALSLEIFILAMLLEEHKEVRALRQRLESLQSPPPQGNDRD